MKTLREEDETITVFLKFHLPDHIARLHMSVKSFKMVVDTVT